MQSEPRSGSKVCEPLDRLIGKSGEDRSQIAAQQNPQPSAVLFLTQCGVTLLRLFGVSRGHLTIDRDSKRSDLPNDQVLACGLDQCGGEMLELIGVPSEYGF
jgi:hypothetical protein